MSANRKSENIDNQEGGFLKFIAYLQIIGIILVVLGHSFHEYPDGRNGYSLLIFRMFYNFRMPLFLFVSGFLMIYTTFSRSKNPDSIKHFAYKKVKRLLLPYAVLTLITYIPRASMSGMADDALPLTPDGMLKALFITQYLPITFFWFIQTSFLLLIVSYTYISIAKRHKIHPGIIFGSIVALFIGAQFVELSEPEIFGTKAALRLGIYFALGMVYCEFYKHINRYLPLTDIYSFLVCLILWAVLFIFGEDTFLSRIASVFGIMMCIALAKLLVKYKLRFLDHLIGANYIIFLLSWYFNVLTQQVLSHFVTLPWWIHTILSLTFGIYIPWLAYLYLRNNRHSKAVRIISLLLGQSFRSKNK